MPDWPQLVRSRLGPLGLDRGREEEIVAELAGYLEDLYTECRTRGVREEETLRQAFHHVPDWTGLRREIDRVERGEETMNRRTSTLWLPGLITLTLSMGLLLLLQWFGPRPMVVWIMGKQFLTLYLPWLVALPAVGALGAYACRRAGGSCSARALAGVFPVLALGVFLILVLPVSLVVDRHVPLALKFTSLAAFLLGWVVIPGAALLAGALPFLKGRPGASPA